MTGRRSFLKQTLGIGSCAAVGDLAFLRALPSLRADDVAVAPKTVRFHPEIEPLVRLLEETPQEQVLEEIASRIRRGLTYRELLAALLLAGVRNIQPRPVGFKFHAVLVINSAHLASLASADVDRWLPIFWSIDQFKNSQADDVRQGDWTLGPVDERAVPTAQQSRAALIAAMDRWDEAAADAAIVGLARTAPAHEIYQLLARYGVRDFREIGHKEIYVANSFRTLETIGWHHAEPVLRSLVYALLDKDGERSNPATSDLPADRPFRRNLERQAEIRADWLDGRADAGATREMLETLRAGSSSDASALAIAQLNRGVSPNSLFDAYLTAAGELLMRAPGVVSLHATTFTNATRYSFQHCHDDATRRMLVLQNAAFLPLFRGQRPSEGVLVDSFEPADVGGKTPPVEEVFAAINRDRLEASRLALAHLRGAGDPAAFAQAARRLIFLKGTNSHDYKFSSAVLEDYLSIHPQWRDRFLAASMFYLRGAADPDNELVARTRAALAAV